jgi:hypothetical protein
MLKRIFFIAVMSTWLAACGAPGNSSGTQDASSSLGGIDEPPSTEVPSNPTTPSTPGVPSSPSSPGLKFCSPLNFKDLMWSASLSGAERGEMTLALNLSGSFEGHDGWSNLAGNFDGQGISMGLLNQPLGTGSLQPMWSEMQNMNAVLMKSTMTSTHYDSMVKMLKAWGATIKAASVLDIKDYGYNDLDDTELVASEMGVDPSELEAVNLMSASTNSASVTWAKQNALTSSGNLKSDWDKQLRALATTAEYRSIQVEKAQKIHDEAMTLFKYFGATQLSSYLFFFDIVVQNGGISSTVKSQYSTWLKTHKTADEKTRLLQLLSYRLKTVRAAYVNDVKTRKTSILNGKGTVHGSTRDYQKEYCTTFSQKI